MKTTRDATEDFGSLADMADHSREILEQVQRTKRPLIVTVEGKPEIVVLDAATYERRLQAMELARLLAEGEADIRAGRTRPAEEFFAEMERANKIPSRARGKSRK